MKAFLLRRANLNAGDHLITARVRAHLSEMDIGHDLVDRLEASETRARGAEKSARQVPAGKDLIAAGGPLVGRTMVPDKLAENFFRSSSVGRFFFYGVGLAPTISPFGNVKFNLKEFSFSAQTDAVLRESGKFGQPWSVRDPATMRHLSQFNENVTNTGCPALFRDIRQSAASITSLSSPRKILVSAPARPVRQFWQLLVELRTMFPLAELSVLLQAGIPNWNLSPRQGLNPHLTDVLDPERNLRETSMKLDLSIIDTSSDLEHFEQSVASSDTVIGYRLHAHILALSLGIPSVVIAEDQRSFHFQENFPGTPQATYKQTLEEVIPVITAALDSNEYWKGITEAMEELRMAQIEYLARLRSAIEN